MTAYLQRKSDELQQMQRTTGAAGPGLASRQSRFLETAAEDPTCLVTAKQYATQFRVSDETARQDLNELAAQGLLTKSKAGKAFQWGPAEGLAEKLRR